MTVFCYSMKKSDAKPNAGLIRFEVVLKLAARKKIEHDGILRLVCRLTLMEEEAYSISSRMKWQHRFRCSQQKSRTSCRLYKLSANDMLSFRHTSVKETSFVQNEFSEPGLTRANTASQDYRDSTNQRPGH